MMTVVYVFGMDFEEKKQMGKKDIAKTYTSEVVISERAAG
jgi:hypothetical protein